MRGARGGAACSRPIARAAAAPTSGRPSRWRRSRAATSSQTLTLAAEFRPFQEIEVHAKVAGFVKSINVDVGDRVQRRAAAGGARDSRAAGRHAAGRGRGQARAARKSTARRPISTRAESAHEVAHLGSTRLAAVMKQRPNLVAQQDIDEAQGRDRVAEAQVATAKAALAPRAGAARRRQGQPEQDARRCSPTRGSRRRSPASSRTATPTPAR